MARSRNRKEVAASSAWPWSAVGLLALILWHSDLLIGRSTFFFRDLQTTHAPAMAAFSRIGFSRTTPFASFGQPYLGNPNLLVAYPFFKNPDFISLYVILHLMLCLAGVVVFLRRMSVSADAAWFGALTFTLSGYVLSAASSLNSATTIAWMPWVLWTAEDARRGELTWRRAPLALVIAVMFLLSGEPVLIAVTILLAIALMRPWDLQHGAAQARWVVAGLTGVLVTAPVHMETWRAASASFRAVRGYTFEQAVTGSLHPARLLEVFVPFLFGDPSKLGPGAFWGYSVSRGARPYVYSVTISLVALSLVLAYVSTAWQRERFWVVAALSFLVGSCGGFLPGAGMLRSIAERGLPVRFPIKFFLFFTLCISVLAAFAFDYLAGGEAGKQRHPRSPLLLGMLSMALVALAGIAASGGRVLEQWLAALWWNPTWVGVPELVLSPIIAGIPARLFLCSLIVGVAAWVVARGGGNSGRIALQVTLLLEGLALVPSLLPAVPCSMYREQSDLVRAAQALHGRIFERASKELDPVVNGLRGRYESNDVRQLAVAQARQAWALSGVRQGIRYAFDPSPDGSYSDRNQIVYDAVEKAAWPVRLKWLRAGGVVGIISSERASDITGVRFRATERHVGVPANLYAIENPLAEVRRVGRAVVASSTAEALRLFASPSFDERTSIVVEHGRALSGLAEDGTIVIRRETPDSIEVETNGVSDAYVLLARSYTKRLRAVTLDGRMLPVVPANVTWTAVLVSRGPVIFRLDE